uniref:Uncharacterized protein n=1 Tax=Anopheles atroparvus TaxID=41427 RepID=A0AAG5DKE1_ANOAO
MKVIVTKPVDVGAFESSTRILVEGVTMFQAAVAQNGSTFERTEKKSRTVAEKTMQIGQTPSCHRFAELLTDGNVQMAMTTFTHPTSSYISDLQLYFHKEHNQWTYGTI